MSTPSESIPQPAIKDERIHFLAHMGHDLRAPMTSILALTEVYRAIDAHPICTLEDCTASRVVRSPRLIL